MTISHKRNETVIMPELSGARLFIFDFDGTLVQSNAIKRNVFYEVVECYAGASALLDQLLQADPPLDRYGISEALAARIDGIDSAEIAEVYTTLCEERIVAAPEVPGASNLLAALRDTGRFCVINSATPEQALRSIVERLPFAHLVHAVFGTPTSKGENIRRAMKRFGVTAHETVMVGDNRIDQAAAVENACTFVGVGAERGAFAPPFPLVVSRLDALIAAL